MSNYEGPRPITDFDRIVKLMRQVAKLKKRVKRLERRSKS